MSCLFVVGTPIGNLGDISPRAIETLQSVELVACEDSRRTGALYQHLGIVHPKFVVLNDHSERGAVDRLTSAIANGSTVALVSDAGMPLISDPGWLLVQSVISTGLPVDVIPGPTAVTSALVLSGLPADRYRFEGFLPRSGKDRISRIRAVSESDSTSVIYESPHRLSKTLSDLAEVAEPERPVAVCREITKLHQEVWRCSLQEASVRAAESRVKGEIVIVVGGAPPKGEVTDDGIVEALSAELEAGFSKRDAAEAVAESLGVPKRRAYRLAIELD